MEHVFNVEAKDIIGTTLTFLSRPVKLCREQFCLTSREVLACFIGYVDLIYKVDEANHSLQTNQSIVYFLAFRELHIYYSLHSKFLSLNINIVSPI